jgi:hypothetical protein
MKNQKIVSYILFLVAVFAFTGTGVAQSLQKTQALVQEEVAISWKDARFGVTEYQSVEFSEDKMVVTRKSVFKDTHESKQTAIIPLARIDVSRLQSYEAVNLEGMYYLSIFTKDNENTIKVTTFYGKDTEDNIVETFYYTLYSKSRDQNQALKEKIEHLIYLLGKSG